MRGGGRRRFASTTTLWFGVLGGFSCRLADVGFAKVEALAVKVDKLASTLNGEFGPIAEFDEWTVLLRNDWSGCRGGGRFCENVAAILKKEDGMKSS